MFNTDIKFRAIYDQSIFKKPYLAYLYYEIVFHFHRGNS